MTSLISCYCIFYSYFLVTKTLLFLEENETLGFLRNFKMQFHSYSLGTKENNIILLKLFNLVKPKRHLQIELVDFFAADKTQRGLDPIYIDT